MPINASPSLLEEEDSCTFNSSSDTLCDRQSDTRTNMPKVGALPPNMVSFLNGDKRELLNAPHVLRVTVETMEELRAVLTAATTECFPLRIRTHNPEVKSALRQQHLTVATEGRSIRSREITKAANDEPRRLIVKTFADLQRILVNLQQDDLREKNMIVSTKNRQIRDWLRGHALTLIRPHADDGFFIRTRQMLQSRQERV